MLILQDFSVSNVVVLIAAVYHCFGLVCYWACPLLPHHDDDDDDFSLFMIE